MLAHTNLPKKQGLSVVAPLPELSHKGLEMQLKANEMDVLAKWRNTLGY